MKPTATLKISVTRILKEHLYQGKSGKYLDLAIWPNKDGADQYGNTHFVTQSVSKEEREKGVRGPIVGNARIESTAAPRPTAAVPPAPSAPPAEAEEPFDDVPF